MLSVASPWRVGLPALGLGVVVAMLVGGAPTLGKDVEIPVPPLSADLKVKVHPKSLPESRAAHISLEVRAAFSTLDATQVPALREAVIDISKGGRINASSLPTCGRREVEAGGDGSLCKRATVGSGSAAFEVAPTQQKVHAHLTAINGGVKGQAVTLFVLASFKEASSQPLLTVAKVAPVRGSGAMRATWRLPRLLGGNGSLQAFDLTLDRVFSSGGEKTSFLQAQCETGKLAADIRGVFKDEAGTGIGDQTVTANYLAPC